ncbi:MAG: PEP-CTERM sorting domain-containing protein [Phycisphaerales bacterium]
MRRTVFAASLFVLAAGSAAQALVVPNGLENTEADGTFSLTTSSTAGRTFQLSMAANQLTSLVGQQITGLQWRLNGAASANWPPVDVSYAFWDVFMGPGVAPSAMSSTFADNFTGAATQVRSGGAMFTAGSFTAGGSPNAFGPALNFTSPYLYTGGDLIIEMRFAQQIGATTQSAFDAVLASGGPANGWGVDYAGRWTGNAAGTTGNNGNFLVTNLVAVPAPASLALLGLGLAARRRSR